MTFTREGLVLSPEVAALVDEELATAGPSRRAVLGRMLYLAGRDGGKALATLESFVRSEHSRFDVRGEDATRPTRAERPRCGAPGRTARCAPCSAAVVCRRDAEGRIILAERCRRHGGISAGAKTAEDYRRCVEAARRRWERWQAERS